MRTKRNPGDTPDNLKLCGIHIRILRMNYKLSQGDMAKLLGTAVTNICTIERGQHLPGLCIISKAVTTFGVSADWLLGLSKRDVNEPNLEKSEKLILMAEGQGSDILKQAQNYAALSARINTYKEKIRKEILVYASILNYGDEKFSRRLDAENCLKKRLEHTPSKK